MGPNQQLALAKYRQIAPIYDPAPLEPLRRRTIPRLRLQPGDVVLDVGCGTGSSFPLIEERIGPEGRLIGIEQSPEMLARARQQVARRGWQNVTLIEAAAQEAEIPVQADAALTFFVHDITRSPEALENVFKHVKPGGRVASACTKWAPWWAVPLNFWTWYIARRYVTSLEGMGRPWRHIERFAPNLQVESAWLGRAYIAWGTAR